MLKLSIIFVIAFFITLSHAQEIPETLKQLATWETKANGVAVRNNQPVKIEHFEIPLKKLESDVSPYIAEKLNKSLIFEKNGVEYVRWLINPEDTKWYVLLEKWLVENNLDKTHYQYYTGFQTASRSYLLWDPVLKTSFSAKVSTNKTGGNWTDKYLPVDDSREIRKTNDLVAKVRRRINFEHIDFLIEPMYFGIPEINQAMLIRELNEVSTGRRYYMPLFSLLHETEGVKIAKLNGFKSPNEFLEKKVMPILGKAFGEFYAHLGLSYDSGHGQNFLLELDQDKQVTGKFIFKDFADAYVSADYYKDSYSYRFMRDFTADNVKKNYFEVSVGLLHGNVVPSWIDEDDYLKLNRILFDHFGEEFSKITTIPFGVATKKNLTHYSDFSYVSQGILFSPELREKFFDLADCYQGAFKTKKGVLCPEHLLTKNYKKEFYQEYLKEVGDFGLLDGQKVCSKDLK